MASLSRTIRHLGPCAVLLYTLCLDAVKFLRYCLCSPAALAAENFFLRKQLALYQRRRVMPRCATDATRSALAWLSQWFDWQPVLVGVQPEIFRRWRRQRRSANALRLKLSLRVSPRTVRKYMPTPCDRVPGDHVPSQRWRTVLCNHAWELIVSSVRAGLRR